VAALALIVVAGIVIAAVQSHRSRRDTIVATPAVVSDLEEERRELLGRALTDAERERLVEDWVDQEVLVREAYRRGLDHGDGVIRHRLVEKMRALLAEKHKDPSREELLAFHRDNEERYRSPARVSFEHVFIGRRDAAARARLEALRPELRGGADFRRMGERFWLGPTLEAVTPTELGRVLGDDCAKAVFALDPSTWTGPIASTRGLHLIRVTEMRASEAVPFEAVAGAVREDWYEMRERETLRLRIDELKKRYRIETAPASGVSSPPASPS
jgi:peptidyl-prolyl cis-trans isomerase C